MKTAFERREYIFERTGWLLMALVVTAALLGLLGKGYFSHKEIKSDHLTLEYERFLHFGDPTTLLFNIEPGPEASQGIRLSIANAYLTKFRIVQIMPEPESLASGDRTTFVFKSTAPQQSLLVQFHIEPEQFGRVEGRIQVESIGTLDFNQFIYP